MLFAVPILCDFVSVLVAVRNLEGSLVVEVVRKVHSILAAIAVLRVVRLPCFPSRCLLADSACAPVH